MPKAASNKKIQWAWTMYDWANSVHSLTIATALFPIYWENVTGGKAGIVHFLGINFKASSLYAYSLSFAFLFIALLNPLLSGIADKKGNKKSFMRFFVFLGGMSCFVMYFFDKTTIPLGIATFVFSMIGYAGSLVFYNAYLPEIAKKEEYDKLSARGFAMGYIGCVILLLFNLAMTMYPSAFGLADAAQGIRISFVSVGIWWIGFSFIPFYYLPSTKSRSIKVSVIDGYRESYRVFKKVKLNKGMMLFLAAFFFYAMGTQTTMYLAMLFGTEELKIETDKLILTVLLIQLLGIVGAYFYAHLASKIGGIKTLITIVFIWILICILAYFTTQEYEFYWIAGLVGFIMGGVQSLSRSTYSKFLPKEEEHSSYYSFYELTEKIAIVLGTFSYGFIAQITGGMRPSVLALALYFIVGLFILFRLNKYQNTTP